MAAPAAFPSQAPEEEKGGAEEDRPDSLRRRAKPFAHAGSLGVFVLASAALALLVLPRLPHSDFYGLVVLLRQTPLADAGRKGGALCDWSEGKWVWDEEHPLYASDGCAFLDQGFRCSENGRPDRLYTKWRWQPAGCELPRFDSINLLEKLRHRRLVFVGDSIGRNQWESLLCMLSTSVSNKNTIYEVNGRPITKHTGHPPVGAPKHVKTTLRLDFLDWTSKSWKDADILIFNTGHWWNYEKTIRGGCYFQEGDQVKTEMSVENAYQRSIQTLFQWIHKEVNRNKTQVIFRTYAPSHFRVGDWKNGGSCHSETLPDLSPLPLSLEPWEHYLEPFREVPSENFTANEVLELDLLNVTQMTARRKDGHLSRFYLGISALAPLRRQDCSHWCLPGVPDAWNEILYALIMQRESMMHKNTTITGTTRVKLAP